MTITESKIQEYIANKIDLGDFKIDNLSEYKKKIKKIQDDFFKTPYYFWGANSKDLIVKVFADKIERSLNYLEDLVLVDKEFEVYKNGLPGKNPSLDIFAYTEISNNFVLIEIKKSSSTERESVTELSAYSEFLNKKFFGLGKNNLIWVPISKDWKDTTKNAIKNQMFSSNQICIPLKLKVNSKDNENIDSINLEIVDFIDEIKNISENLCHSLFSWASYDILTINFKEEIENPENLMHLVSSWCSELNISGFIYVTKPNYKTDLMFPWGIVVAFFNPLKAYLKQKELDLIKDEYDKLKRIKQNIPTYFDADLIANESFWDIPMIKERNKISIKNLSLNYNQMDIVIRKFQDYFSRFLKIGEYEFGHNELKRVMDDSSYHWLNAIQKFTYFGFLESVVSERINYDFSLKDKLGDSKIVGALPNSPFSLYSDWSYFFTFMSIMNFEHESQDFLYNKE